LLGSERIIMETPAANSYIRLGTPNDPDYLRDRSPGKGIKIFTKGELIEESQDHQTITLDPVEDYNEAKNFELSDDAYKAIQQDLKKGNEHIQKNIDIINEYDAFETQAKVKAEYERERNRLEDLKIDVSDPNPDADKRVTDDDYLNDQTTEIYKIIDYLKDICSKGISKTDFVSKFEKDNLDNFTIDGINNWKSNDDNYPGKRDIIASAILRNTISNNAKQRDIKISGDQINSTEGSHKITAINGERLFEMTDQGIFIDAGEDRDITIKCRKFFLKNEDEDNITYGDDFAEHYGTNVEHFYGKSDETFYGEKTEAFYGHKKDEHHGTTEEYFYGNKFCHTGASVEDIHWGHKLEVFGGFQEEISLIHAFAFFLGMKEEITNSLSIGINLSAIFEYNFLKGEKTTIDIGSHDVDVKDGMVKIDGKKLKLEGGFVMLA